MFQFSIFILFFYFWNFSRFIRFFKFFPFQPSPLKDNYKEMDNKFDIIFTAVSVY